MSKHLIDYINTFNKMPPLITLFSYDNPVYQNLILRAIKEKKEITQEMLDEVLKNYSYDIN
jgi:hypothetical protein